MGVDGATDITDAAAGAAIGIVDATLEAANDEPAELEDENNTESPITNDDVINEDDVTRNVIARGAIGERRAAVHNLNNEPIPVEVRQRGQSCIRKLFLQLRRKQRHHFKRHGTAEIHRRKSPRCRFCSRQWLLSLPWTRWCRLPRQLVR